MLSDAPAIVVSLVETVLNEVALLLEGGLLALAELSHKFEQVLLILNFSQTMSD